MRGQTILVVDDEQHIVEVVEYKLREEGFTVVSALSGDQGWRAFRTRKPDLVILDLGLPGISGKDLFKQMREQTPGVPVIMLTARHDEIDRVTGLELGADDYVTKPFSPPELAARVRAVLRRCSPDAAGSGHTLTVGPIEMETEAFRVTYHGTPMILSRQEFAFLECLLRHPGRIYSREALMDAMYDGETFVDDRSIDAHVKRLRKKLLGIRPRPDPVQTVYGLGYKLNQELERHG